MEADDSCEDTVSVLSDSTEEQIDDSSAIRSKRKNGESTKNGPASKKKRKNELYKPPTVEELNSLKETENLFNNNLFRLQIQEIITEVTIKNKRRKHLLEWTLSFEKFLETLPDYEVSLSELNKAKKKGKQSKFCTKLAQYESIFETDQDVELKFLKLASFEKFGLYENGSLPGPNLITNINLMIPKSCFAPKDFLNNRYLTKRYYYLTYIAEHLKKSELVTTLKISFHEGNHLLPVIELTPSGCDKTTLFIYVTPEETTFKPARFLVLQNNVKLDMFKMTVDIDILKNSPTIFYNSAISHDATLSLNNRFITESLKDQSNIQDGVKLLCIWLRQRELNIGLGSFTENLILYIIVYLVSNKKINKYMSSYQVVRNFWSFISSTDLQNEPISIGETTTDVLSDFKKYFDIVLVDCTGCYNVASFLNLDVYKKVKLECQSALQLLDDNKHNTFCQLFLTRYPFHLQFDLVIDLTESLPLEQKNSEQEKALYAGYADLLKCNNVLKIIKKALNKRAFVLVPRIEIDHRIIKSFIIGANLNPDEAYNFLETGPALSDYDPAEEFRKFWAIFLVTGAFETVVRT
ncbi:hypothetical protein JTB14_002384 [Gonioctena quinquepunctata]|nr:hypothetical protein JTB14_002384 [Gonioctena quinquepunctata]